MEDPVGEGGLCCFRAAGRTSGPHRLAAQLVELPAPCRRDGNPGQQVLLLAAGFHRFV